MNRLFKALTVATLGLGTTIALASPSSLIIHNKTDVESNAYINGIESPKPTKPQSSGSVSWIMVKMVCQGHTSHGKCPALIKMATDTENPVELGTVQLNLETGEITPLTLSANGYTFTANGPGETTLTKD